MVSAYLVDALKDPISELEELYARTPSSVDFPSEVARHFSTVFSADNAFSEIPVLNVHHPPTSHRDRKLVRFRAMVQDTSPSSEMYLRRSKGGTLGGWGIHFTDDEISDIDFNELRECSILWAVSIPGESFWCEAELDGSTAGSHSSYVPIRSYKYPGSESHYIGVQVKIYNSAIAEHLKPTDLVTFVGILTNEPLSNEEQVQADVPTLHVLFTRFHDQSIISRSYPLDTTNSETTIAQTRQKLIAWMANESLGGDQETAQWILLAVIARVQSRHPPLVQPTFTISHFPPPPKASDSGVDHFPPSLMHVLSNILPLARMLPLSLDVLNKSSFIPESKDEDLHSGALQLPQGSVLLVTEHGIQEGKLIEQGLSNISSLQEMMSSQTLAYQFPFSRFTFPTDISCMVLTEGRKSTFFKTDITVPLERDDTTFDPSAFYKPANEVALPSPEDLKAFRDLVIGSRLGRVQVNEATSQYIQQDFVRDRQQNPAIISDDLIRRMTIAKLYALSLHEAELSIDTWKLAKAFDERRKARLT